jgi:4-oxalocrotonate tautomerase
MIIDGGDALPVVIIEMWAGETDEQKAELIRGITQVLTDTINAKPERLHIIIHESPKNNWGLQGEQASKLFG